MRALAIVFFFLAVAMSYGQSPVMEKVTSELCDTLSKVEKPLEDISEEEYMNMMRTVIAKNSSDWIQELDAFKKRSKNITGAEHDFAQHFLHVLQMDCQNFRTIASKFDTYLSDKENLRPLHLRTKEFVISLEDEMENDGLFKLLSDSLKNENVESLLNSSRIELGKFKRTSTPSIILVYDNGYTFRVRYDNYLTHEPDFLIDVVFKDDSDFLIDNLIIKGKTQLMIEFNENIEFNKKVKSGEIKVTPPPPPPAPKRN